jgi:hypothetical protein
MSIEIGLVSCVSSKRDTPAPPRDLYTSPYFEKMRAYADSHHDDWWILSAEYGFLDPDGPEIDPYDTTLTNATVEQKRDWARRVESQLKDAGLLAEDTTLVIHAGLDYYEELLPIIENEVHDVRIPTEGMRIGEKLSWYNDRI